MSTRLVMVPGAGIECLFGCMIHHRLSVPAKDRVAGIAKKRPGLDTFLLISRILPEGVGNFDRLPVIGRVVASPSGMASKQSQQLSLPNSFIPLSFCAINVRLRVVIISNVANQSNQ